MVGTDLLIILNDPPYGTGSLDHVLPDPGRPP